MSKWFTPPADFDMDEAEELVWQVWRDAGLTETHSRWGERVNTDKVGGRLRNIFLDKYTIENENELKKHPERAAWDVDVVEEFFPGVRILVAPATTAEEAAAQKVMEVLWGYTSTSLTSALNLAVEPDGYFVLEKTVSKKRPAPGKEGGVGIPRLSRFLSSDFDLLRDLALDRDIVKFKRAAERLENALKNHGDRRREYRVAIAKYAGKDMPAIMGILTHANAKSVAALEEEARAATVQPDEDFADSDFDDE
jgi:hypothetical protein